MILQSSNQARRAFTILNVIIDTEASISFHKRVEKCEAPAVRIIKNHPNVFKSVCNNHTFTIHMCQNRWMLEVNKNTKKYDRNRPADYFDLVKGDQPLH